MTTPDLTADRVASINIYRKDDAPTPAQVARFLPDNFRVGKGHSAWNIIVRGKDTEDATLEHVIDRLRRVGIEAKEVERETNAIYQFRTGRDGGSGSFLTPPGHPAQRYSIYGYHSSGNGKPRTNRSSGPDVIMSIEGLAEDEGGYYPKPVVERAKRILAEAQTDPSEAWVRNVYAYFRHSYSPDGADRNVSNAVSYHGKTTADKCRCGASFNTPQALIGHIAGKRRDLPGRTGQVLHHKVDGEKPQPPEHHLGYLCVREYFPEHTPREDLIADPGRAYGGYPCDKCGQRVQYEARQDSWCVVKTSPWSYDPDCPEGGHHEVRPYENRGTRKQVMGYMVSKLGLNEHQAATMTRAPGDYYVKRAAYPGGAPNPIVGAVQDWGFAGHDDHYRVTRTATVFEVAPVMNCADCGCETTGDKS